VSRSVNLLLNLLCCCVNVYLQNAHESLNLSTQSEQHCALQQSNDTILGLLSVHIIQVIIQVFGSGFRSSGVGSVSRIMVKDCWDGRRRLERKRINFLLYVMRYVLCINKKSFL